MLRRDMFLEGRLWRLGFETGQMRREKLRRQAGDRHRGQKEAGVFIHLRRAECAAGLKQD